MVGADTYLLILLFHTLNDSTGSMAIKCERTKKYSQTTRNIGEMAKCLTHIKYLIFILAFGGCDTTSATYELGKISIMKAIEKKKTAKEATGVFLSPESTHDEAGAAGAKFFVTLYGREAYDDLTDCVK